MVGSTICTLDKLFDIENNMAGRPQWVLNPPQPPGLWHELVDFMRESVLPHRNKLLSSNQRGTKRAISVFKCWFPILCWCQNYDLKTFKNDLIAGLTLASLCIPQSMGYATLAHLEPQYGLYTSIVPPLIYAMMGTSRDLVIGAVAVDSLLLSSMILESYPGVDAINYKKIVFTTTLFAGVFQTACGVFRLGFLVDFLSHAAIIGFMAGAAIIIGLQQLKGLFGIKHFTDKTDIVSVMKSVWGSLHNTTSWQPYNLVLGGSFLCFILVCRVVGKRNKKLFWLPAVAPFVSFIFSTLIVMWTNAEKHSIEVVEQIKGGLLHSSVHQLQLDGLYPGASVTKIGIIIATIGLMEAIAVGRSFASIKGYHIDANKEMISLGLMNIVGSLSSCYVTTGSFSRTAVNFSAGGETLGTNVVMSITVMISMQLLTKFVHHTPKAILASIIISALPGLIDLNGAHNVWKVDTFDFLACLGAFFGMLFSGVETGLLLAITLSFVKIILGSIQPGTETLGKIPGTDTYSDVGQYPMALQIPGVLIIRIKSAWLCFANANSVRERITRLLSEEEEEEEDDAKKTTKVVVLDMLSLMNIDTSGIASLRELHQNLVSQGMELVIVNPRWQVIHKLRLADFFSKIGVRIFLTVGEAISASFDIDSTAKMFPLKCHCTTTKNEIDDGDPLSL